MGIYSISRPAFLFLSPALFFLFCRSILNQNLWALSADKLLKLHKTFFTDICISLFFTQSSEIVLESILSLNVIFIVEKMQLQYTRDKNTS